MDERKQCLIVNVIDFLQNETFSSNLTEDQKESIEVAIQCLETAFEVNEDTRKKFESSKADLLSSINVRTKVEVTPEQAKEAEECKNRGNANMKNSAFNEAVDEYTRAIKLNPTNPVYFCNRAAAFSKLEKHLAAMEDCKEAIRLDPTYGKAYGRLGIAYSNLNRFEDARTAYMTALKYDPGNAMYETNLKLAEERLVANMESAAPPEHVPLDISQFINNPNLINMATQMLGDSNFRNLISGIMSSGQFGDPNFDALLQAGQTLANRMRTSDPNFVDNLRRSFDVQQNNQGSNDGGAKNEESNSKKE